jgi:hypothetical protein
MLCCKLFELDELEKPRGKWCQHAAPGKGCSIHADRPTACRTFFCNWIMDLSLGPDWKPNKAKFIIQSMPGGNVQILVDPAHPSAWKADTYYPTLKLVAAQLFERGKYVIVSIGTKGYVILPQKDVPIPQLPTLGSIRVEQAIIDGKPDFRVVVDESAAPQA